MIQPEVGAPVASMHPFLSPTILRESPNATVSQYLLILEEGGRCSTTHRCIAKVDSFRLSQITMVVFQGTNTAVVGIWGMIMVDVLSALLASAHGVYKYTHDRV